MYSLLPKKFASYNKMYFLLAVIFIIVLFAVVFRRRLERFVGYDSDESGGNVIVKYFYMDGCGHCKRFKPEWDIFESQALSDPSQSISPMKYEARKDKDSIDSDVNGFPTVKVIKNGVTCVYTGERTAAALNDYINNFDGVSCPP
jgi:hypothetical protein